MALSKKERSTQTAQLNAEIVTTAIKKVSGVARFYEAVTVLWTPDRAARFRHYRRYRDLTQADAAILLGVTQQVISDIELDRTRVTDRFTLGELSKFLGTATLYVLIGTNAEKFEMVPFDYRKAHRSKMQKLRREREKK